MTFEDWARRKIPSFVQVVKVGDDFGLRIGATTVLVATSYVNAEMAEVDIKNAVFDLVRDCLQEMRL